MKTELSLVAQSDSVIISLQRASSALAEAKTIQHTKKIIDLAAAAEIWAKRQQLGQEAVDYATSIKLEALRKLGEILKATPKNQGAKGSAVPNKDRAQSTDETPTLSELGIDKKTSSVAQALANLTDAAFEEVREGNETVAKAIAKVKEAKAKPAAQPPEPEKVEPATEAPPEYTELDRAHDQITELQSELVVARMGDIPEDQKTQAAERIAELQAELNTATAVIKSLTHSRDTLQEENAQMKRQMKAQREEIARLKANK